MAHRTYGICDTCGDTLGLTPGGKIVSHTAFGRYCRGSRRPPEAIVEIRTTGRKK